MSETERCINCDGIVSSWGREEPYCTNGCKSPYVPVPPTGAPPHSEDGMNDTKGLTPPVPPLVALKLASLVVHCEELLAPGGHDFDRQAISGILSSPDLRDWIAGIDDVMLPRKRSKDGAR